MMAIVFKSLNTCRSIWTQCFQTPKLYF